MHQTVSERSMGVSSEPQTKSDIESCWQACWIHPLFLSRSLKCSVMTYLSALRRHARTIIAVRKRPCAKEPNDTNAHGHTAWLIQSNCSTLMKTDSIDFHTHPIHITHLHLFLRWSFPNTIFNKHRHPWAIRPHSSCEQHNSGAQFLPGSLSKFIHSYIIFENKRKIEK